MKIFIFVLAFYGPLTAFAACDYTAVQTISPLSVSACPSAPTTQIYATPTNTNMVPLIGSTKITIYMRATVINNCGITSDNLYLYNLRKTSPDKGIISMAFTNTNRFAMFTETLVGMTTTASYSPTVTYLLTYDLVTGETYAGIIASSVRSFFSITPSSHTITSFPSDMTLYLCGAGASNTGFLCSLDEFKMWPVFDKTFLLSFLLGQTRNALFLIKTGLKSLATPLYLFALTETSGTSAANTYSPSNSGTLSTTGLTLPTWATTGIGINIADPGQYIDIPGFSLGTGGNAYIRGSYTISTWIKIAAAPTTSGSIFLRTSSAGTFKAGITLGSDRKINVILESSTSYIQTSNGVVPLNTWTSITVTIVQTLAIWGYAASSIVINDVLDQSKLYDNIQAATSTYLLTDINMIGGAPTSLVGIFAHFTIYSPGSMAFSVPPCPVQTNSRVDLGFGATQSLIPVCDTSCDACYGASATECLSCASGKGFSSNLCSTCPTGTIVQDSACITPAPAPPPPPTPTISTATNNEMGSAETAALAAKIGAIAMAGVAGATFVMQANPAILWALINLLQMFYYLTFINVDYPLNVEIFLEMFQVASLDFIPNPIEDIFSDVEKNSISVPGKYAYNEIEGLFLINSYPIFLTWGAYVFFYLFALLASKCIPKDSKTLRKYISKIVDWYQWSGLLGILIASYPDIVQSAFLQVRALSFSAALFSISSVLSIVFTIFGLGLPILFAVIIYRNGNNLTNLKKKYQILVEKCNIGSRIPRHITTIYLLRALIVNGALVFLQDYPVVQISLLIGANTIILCVFIFKRNVFTSLIDTFCRVFQEFFFIAIYTNILILTLDATTFSEEAKLKVGWIIIGCCAAIFVVFLGNEFYDSFHAIKDLFRSFRQPPSKRKTSEKRRKQRRQELDEITHYDMENPELSLSNTKAPLNLNSSLETSFDHPRLGNNKVIKTSDHTYQRRSHSRSQANIERSPIIASQPGASLRRNRTITNTDRDRPNKVRSNSTHENPDRVRKRKKKSEEKRVKNMNPIFRSELYNYK